MDSRLQGLDSGAIQQIVATAQALEAGRADDASARIAPLLASHPENAEVLRLHAGVLDLRGRSRDAIGAMQRAVAQRPHDPLYYNTLGTVLGNAGEFDAAVTALRRACELQPDLAIAWFNLGVMLTRCVRFSEAEAALRRTVELAPDHMQARALLADMLRVRDDVAEAQREYRKVLTAQPWSGIAWWGLADLKTVPFESGDIERMHAALRDPRASDDDSIATGFALAKALDDDGNYAQSLDALEQANAIARRRRRWNAEAFSGSISTIHAAFSRSNVSFPTSDLGNEVIFIVGLPRSGSTLVEHILASHSQVEGAGELPDVPLTLSAESQHRGQPFPQWVGAMGAEKWRALGMDYLRRTSHWREQRAVFTDKLPANWIYIGAIRAMLPNAKIICCLRDPLETCFSCYRQYLAGNEYSRTFEDLAAYWRDYEHSVSHWAEFHPAQVFQHRYEDLIADPETSIRNLLAFCDLPFEESCLRFHENPRDVRSPSAMQVRQPLRSDRARAERYGALLDPLRRALGVAVPAG